MTQLALIDEYQAFMSVARPLVNITNDADYHAALEALEETLESASDSIDDPFNPLIDMLSHAIEKYESQDDELNAFISEAENIPVDIALVRTLMRQHKLTGNDLPEIGDKTMVSKVLNEKRSLTRSAIEKLCARFGLRPSQFFGE
jgi:HTH-type transcriptional regulator/antitoxin HigA